MSDRFPWRTAFKIAWRESRAAPAKFVFVILAVAVGVGALTGVRGFSRSFRDTLLREARTLMAADLTVRVFDLPTADQAAVMEQLEKRGARRTCVTETVSMVSSPAVPEPLLVALKAVDPSVYPFYGAVRLDSGRSLATELTDETILVSEDLLIRLRVNVGDNVRLGGREFRVAGVVLEEPDRMTGSLNVGPRLMISREGLERTGLITKGSRAAQRYLFRVPAAGLSVAELRENLRKVFPRGRIVDFRETHPLITQGLDDATVFLSLVSLIAMMVGAVGVATAMRAHLERRMDSIAVMKSIGGRSGQILRIYLLQTGLLGAAGSLLGILLGLCVEQVFPLLIQRYVTIRPPLRFDLVPALQGLLIGLAVTLLFTLPALLRIRGIRPVVLLRRDMPEAKSGWTERVRKSRIPLAAAAALLVGIGLITAWLSDSLRTAGFFVGGAVACLGLMSGVAWLLLRSLKALLRRWSRSLPVPLRYGMANLYRPGNHAGAVLVALGTGVMFILTVYLVQSSLLDRLIRSAPSGMPNVFLVNITEADRSGLTALLSSQPGVLRPPQLLASVEARLTTVNGVAVERPIRGGRRGRDYHPHNVTWADRPPANTQIMTGQWWGGKVSPGDPQVAVAEETASRLSIRPGVVLGFSIAGKTVTARVACLHRTESIRPGSSVEFIFSPGVLEGLPMTYYGGLRVVPKDVPRLQRVAYEHYPTVTVVNIADVMEIVQGVVDQVALVTRFVAGFVILAGAVILASSVAGTRFRRVRETAILKTVGATKTRVAVIFSVEFLILGGVAGLMGSLLATVFTSLTLGHLFQDAEFQVRVLPNLSAVVLTAVVAVGAGWLASARILGQRPLEVLRGE